MSRSCECDNVKRGERYDRSQCLPCWIFHHSPAVNAIGGGQGVPMAARAPTKKELPLYPCIHRGERIGTRDCLTCDPKKKVRLQVYDCSIHGRCVLSATKPAEDVGACGSCRDRVEPSAKPLPLVQVKREAVMETQSAVPVKMVMPRDKRPVWRGGVLQIWTTRACDRACFGCTQGSNLGGKPEFMTPDQFRVACESLKDYFGVVGVFGGNPAVSPHFTDLCRIMRESIHWEQRGLWCNHPRGKGKICRITFNPAHSNLNVHQSQEAYDEFARDWPECKPYLKGLDSDSRHSPPFVAMKDVIADEAKRWELIQDCDVNKQWSAMICVFRGQLRGYFCELAASQAMLHQDEPDYPDLGVPIVPGWWNQGQEAFEKQIAKHCHECSVPLRGYGELANNENGVEQVSKTHESIYVPKRTGRKVELVTDLIQLGIPREQMTKYLPTEPSYKGGAS